MAELRLHIALVFGAEKLWQEYLPAAQLSLVPEYIIQSKVCGSSDLRRLHSGLKHRLRRSWTEWFASLFADPAPALIVVDAEMFSEAALVIELLRRIEPLRQIRPTLVILLSDDDLQPAGTDVIPRSGCAGLPERIKRDLRLAEHFFNSGVKSWWSSVALAALLTFLIAPFLAEFLGNVCADWVHQVVWPGR